MHDVCISPHDKLSAIKLTDMRSTTAILHTLALFGVGTCTSNLNDLVFAEEWESVLSQMKDDSVIMADPKPPTFAFVSSNNGSTHQEIIQELGLR